MTRNNIIQEETLRNIRLTNTISIALFVLTFLVGTAYFLFSQTENLYLTIWGLSFIFIIPYALNKIGQHNLSRIIISSTLPIGVMIISIYNKEVVLGQNIINPVNYFDIRIVLLNAIIIPFVLFSLFELRWLILSLIPAIICIILFDPIHNYFNVGYYQSGLTSVDYYFSANLFTTITFVFISLVMIFLKRQVYKSEHVLNIENKKVRYYLEVLVKIGNSNNINLGYVQNAKIEILQAVKICLQVSRVSLWNYSSNGEYIECEYLLEGNDVIQTQNRLFRKDYPNYFKSIDKQQLIIAQDAPNNDSTKEFAENYLKPLKIKSMMDAPFLNIGNLGGVICCEHQNEYKSWGAAESMLLKALADFVSYTISIKDRVRQNILLIEKNKEISNINENLESEVKKRTLELEDQNKQLSEYAYINSHILRAPVARISGLYNLFQMEKTLNVNPDILNHMSDSILELENITHQINQAIEENGKFNRSHLKNKN